MLRRLRKAFHQLYPVYQLACCTWRSYPGGNPWCEQEADGGLFEVSDKVESYAKTVKAPSANVVPSRVLQRTLRNGGTRFGGAG